MKKLIILLSLLTIAVIYLDRPVPGDRLVKVVNTAILKSVEIRVLVEKDGQKGGVAGSGVFIDHKGLVLTCAHLFNGFDVRSISIYNSNGEVVFGKLVFISVNKDLALVKTWAFDPTPYVKIANPKTLRLGQEVFAIGNPLDMGLSVTMGILSRLNCDFEFAYNTTQSDTVINPGNSGGPLFNLQGELVGINSFMISSAQFDPVFTGLGFSRSCGQIIEFISQYYKVLKMTKKEH